MILTGGINLDVKYINPFMESTQSVIKMLLGVDTSRKDMHIKKSPFSADQVIIMIGMVGQVSGQVCFELTLETAKKIAGRMMGGMEITEWDEMSRSAVSEMGNMIMGTTSTAFSNSGINVDITPPSLLTGSKIEISNKTQTIAIPFELESIGMITINIMVEKAS